MSKDEYPPIRKLSINNIIIVVLLLLGIIIFMVIVGNPVREIINSYYSTQNYHQWLMNNFPVYKTETMVSTYTMIIDPKYINNYPIGIYYCEKYSYEDLIEAGILELLITGRYT